MTQDEIIEMARQADLGFLFNENWLMHDEMERFAKLVAQHERKKINDESIIYLNKLRKNWEIKDKS